MSGVLKTRSPSFALAVLAVEVSLTRVWRRSKRALCCFANALFRKTMNPAHDRATALLLAAISMMARKGEASSEELLAQADEFLQYITGDDEAELPRPDKRIAGRIPRR